MASTETRVQWNLTGVATGARGTEPSGLRLTLASRLDAVPAGRPQPEVLAPVAVPHVEVVADDREQHRVTAEEEMPVLDRLHAKLVGEVGGAAAVPAGAVPDFGFGARGKRPARMRPSGESCSPG